MGKRLSAIEQRRLDAELLVEKYYGEHYEKLKQLPASACLKPKLIALATMSVKKYGVPCSKAELTRFVEEILERAELRANKAREDYLYSLTRRTKVPIFSASAFFQWKRKQLLAKEQQEKADEDN